MLRVINTFSAIHCSEAFSDVISVMWNASAVFVTRLAFRADMTAAIPFDAFPLKGSVLR